MGNEAGINVSESDLRIALHSLLKEHILLQAFTLKDYYEDKPESNDFREALDKNSRDIARVLGRYFGVNPDAQLAFLDIWRSHIGFMLEYVHAYKKGNKREKRKAIANLTFFAKRISDFLARVDEDFKKDYLNEIFKEHTQKEKSFFEAAFKGDYLQSVQAIHQDYELMGKIADVLTEALLV